MAPITVLSGINSSGKSSFMQPFLMMKQTLDSAFDPGPLLIHGPNVRNNDYAQMFSRGKSRGDAVREFSAAMTIGARERTLTFSSGANGIALKSDHVRSDKLDLLLTESSAPEDLRRLSDALASYAEPYSGLFGQKDRPGPNQFSVYRNRCLLEPYLELDVEGRRHVRLTLGDDAFGNNEVVRFLRGIIHVPGLRGNPERTYSRSAVGATYPGTFETYVASIVYEWGETGDERLAKLAGDLERLGLTWKVRARRLNDAAIELQVGRMQHPQQGGANDMVNVVDVGFGVSQTLPVLVALHAATRGQMVYVEQPEIHLHPRAQFELAQSFVNAAARGVAVVVETHSSLLMRGLQVAVAKGLTRPRDLSLNWFSRDMITGFQKLDVAELDSEGRFGDWPIDFDDVARAADWDFLDAIDGRS